MQSKPSHQTPLDIIAPGLIEQTWSEAEVLGSAVWLWMHSPAHQDMPLRTLPALLLPAIKYRQFILLAQAGRAVCYLPWANLSVEADQRYLRQHPTLMPDADWNSGDRRWVLDWVAPVGHTEAVNRLLRRQFFGKRWGRMLYHRGDERGMRIKTFQGMAVLPQEAQMWFEAHPVAVAPTRNRTTSEAVKRI